MGNKTGLITPFFMLLAGAIASIIMYVRGFDLTTMLWGLLIVLVIFYIIGDVARYLYASIRPRIIPSGDLEMMVRQAKQNGDLTGSVVAFANDEQKDMEGMDADGFMSENVEADSAEDNYTEGYSDEELYNYAAEDTTAAMEGYEDN
ncbi:MAG: hypothetical protein K2G55_10220 [Lachnospiraceae bacterium]|nr:hypothetical protein [Lachnospiraceae bacterium]MDE7202043.1 hypothetical protein [Lachnospiraceae bacterium]